METHFGQKQRSYNIILSPLQMDAGFGPVVTTRRGNDLYAIVGPIFDSSAYPTFDDKALFQELVLHEFCHTFCNPIIDEYYEQLKRDSCLLQPVKKEMRDQGYSTWKACLYELLTRANEVVLNEIIYGPEVANALCKKQVEEDKWIYLEGCVSLLRSKYIPMRKTYKNEQMLLPEIIAYLDAEAKNCNRSPK